ncbi:DivIVA domain-containing protein [Bifidobacterium sp. B4107]|nr:DivIVA domain-containing protein [Bifidobacterium sp. B4107]MCX8652351.1 DivIVA domain-containing protein [Bifidobacterium sp. B4111]MCX8658782.1 DivIVA domain-containing protein [Bifidobacterium sp. B4114]
MILGLVLVWVLGVGVMPLLTPDDIRRVTFDCRRGWSKRDRYDADEVDAYLDECALTISALGKQCERLRAQVPWSPARIGEKPIVVKENK